MLGCSATQRPNPISTLPIYNREQVDRDWRLVEDIQERRNTLIKFMTTAVRTTPSGAKCLTEALDNTVYWEAATVINLYNDNTYAGVVTHGKAIKTIQNAWACIGDL